MGLGIVHCCGVEGGGDAGDGGGGRDERVVLCQAPRLRSVESSTSIEGLGIRLMRGFSPAFPNTGLPNGVCGPRRDNQTKEDLIFLNWLILAIFSTSGRRASYTWVERLVSMQVHSLPAPPYSRT